MKQFNLEQAQKWLEELKNKNTQSFLDIVKQLQQYEETQNLYQCFINMNRKLLNHPKQTQELNEYLLPANNMVVNNCQNDRIKDFINYVKKNKPEVFKKIIQSVKNFSLQENRMELQQANQIKIRIKEIIKHDEGLNKLFQDILNLTPQERIQSLDLNHLKAQIQQNQMQQSQENPQKLEKHQKNWQQAYNELQFNKVGFVIFLQPGAPDQQVIPFSIFQNKSKKITKKAKQPKQPKPKKQPKQQQQSRQPKQKKQRNKQKSSKQPKKSKQSQQQPQIQTIFPFTKISCKKDQKFIFQNLQYILSQKTYLQLVKIIHLYQLNIIKKQEMFQFIESIRLVNKKLQRFLKQIIEKREQQRRQQSIFRPMGEYDFSKFKRLSPSYVEVPQQYERVNFKNKDSIKTNDKILNLSYLNVPHDHGQEMYFDTATKNSHQKKLFKLQDEKYQFDLDLYRLKKSLYFIDKILKRSQGNDDKIGLQQQLSERKKHLHKFIAKMDSMEIFQILYKKDYQEKMQKIKQNVKKNKFQIIEKIKDKIISQIQKMEKIKKGNLKNWHQTADRNFSKALGAQQGQMKKKQQQKQQQVTSSKKLNPSTFNNHNLRKKT